MTRNSRGEFSGTTTGFGARQKATEHCAIASLVSRDTAPPLVIIPTDHSLRSARRAGLQHSATTAETFGD